jgi:hypothetical protein
LRLAARGSYQFGLRATDGTGPTHVAEYHDTVP